MALRRLRESLQPRGALARGSYAAQSAYVSFMLDIIGRLLVAGSAFDKPIRYEVARIPDNLVLGFSVVGTDIALRLRVKKRRFVRESPQTRADIDLAFKHVNHLFMVLSFQESSALAFANSASIASRSALSGLSIRSFSERSPFTIGGAWIFRSRMPFSSESSTDFTSHV